MADPYLIKVPPGVTELDLRPILEPIVYQLLSHFRSHEPHGSRATVSTREVAEFLGGAAARLEFIRLAEQITRMDLVRELKERGWTTDDMEIRWNRYGHSWITLPTYYDRDKDISLTSKVDVLQSMAAAQCEKDLVALARSVLAGRSLLDRMAWEAAADD